MAWFINLSGEPRSTDSELESAEEDGDADYDYSGLVPDMRDGTQELAVAADNSEALEPSNRDVQLPDCGLRWYKLCGSTLKLDILNF